MKKIFISLFTLMGCFSFSQEIGIQDGLLFGVDDINGTARFRGMSGAFGAIGGDMSAINVNPAGSITFANNSASFTGNLYSTTNNSNFNGSLRKNRNNSLEINQAGAVLVFEDASKKWNKFTIGLNYENTNNLDNEINFSGISPTNSIDKYFLRFANGIGNEGVFTATGANFGNLNFIDQQAWLGYNSYILDYDTTNEEYYTNVPNNVPYAQAKNILTTGYNGKVTFNFASSFKDKIFIGANINAHFTDYRKSFTIRERNNGLYSTGTTISEIAFNNDIYTFGNGISFNLGIIAKPIESLRLGLAYETSTWYNLTDQVAQSVQTVRTVAPDDNIFINSNLNPNIITEFEPYKIKTPSKATASFAYIFGKQGLISADVGYKNYGQLKFKPTSIAYFNSLNNAIDTTLKNALEYRIGGEYRIKQVSLRAGYRFEESPYKVDYAMGDLTGYSSGIGYNFGESRIDFAYSYNHRNYNENLISSVPANIARIREINRNFTLTYSINF